ncbi:hypothetical protein, partial [Xylanibacter rodentium]|uniref:hypothetical protein n=1 Tax=Xylanibacter rodentium TaxID=2736289 RepID=UPI00258D6BDB
GDTRIFSPLLYQLSYGTSIEYALFLMRCKGTINIFNKRKNRIKYLLLLTFFMYNNRVCGIV